MFRILLACSVVVALSAVLPAVDSPRPNVLFLFADDMQADTIAALGNPVIQTPNLDKLARRGLSFRRAYMQGGMNAATCTPSRAMLLSGQNLFHIDEKLMRDAIWPEAFAKSGYTTFISGKWHNGEASLARSFPAARSVFVGGMGNPLKQPLRDVKDGRLAAPQVFAKHACEVYVDEWTRFLKEQKDGPFFAYLPFNAPHDPHIVPDDFPIRYAASDIPLPPNFLPQHPWDNGEMAIRDEALLPWPRKPEAIRSMIAEYYRYISFLDSQIGRALDALAASPHAANTIVVFAADSGVARGQHGLIGKQNVYEHSVRVPLILAGPGIPADQKTEALCYLFDVMPTLGKRCAIGPPNKSDGIDFGAVLADPGHAGRSRLMFAYKNVQRAIRDDRFKLIRYPQVDRTQLFDLVADPHERTNLADRPEHAAKVMELMSALEKEMAAAGDKGSLQVANPKSGDWSPPPPEKKAGPAKGRKG